MLQKGEHAGARVAVPMAALAELEAQANRGAETGISGLDELASLQRLAREGKAKVEFVGRRPSPGEVERAAHGAVDALIRDAAVELGGIYVTSDRVSAHAAAAQGIRHHYIRPIVNEVDLTQLALWSFFDAQTMSVHLKADCVPMVKRGAPGAVAYEPFSPGSKEIRHHYIRPIVNEVDLTQLALWSFFDAQTMSVHLKADCVPMVKRGAPGAVAYEPFSPGSKEMRHQDLRNMVRECIEFAKRDYNSFIEMERKGCPATQLGPMRIPIASPPFSDGLEVTAVRPVRKLTLDEYDLPE